MWLFKQLKRLEQGQADIMTALQDLKTTLDAIAADIAPVQAGINALEANLAAAVAANDPAMLQAALTEAGSIKTSMDALAQSFAAAGSPVPPTPAPAAGPTSGT